MLIAIDPGLRNIGLAIFDRGELQDACLVRETTNPRSAYDHSQVVEALKSRLPCLDPGTEGVIEQPQIYRTAHQRGSQSDLIDLASVVGAVAEALAQRGVRSTYVLPRTWKGQLSKEISEGRSRKLLNSDERERINLPTQAGLRHNVWDAIGIGLWAVKR